MLKIYRQYIDQPLYPARTIASKLYPLILGTISLHPLSNPDDKLTDNKRFLKVERRYPSKHYPFGKKQHHTTTQQVRQRGHLIQIYVC